MRLSSRTWFIISLLLMAAAVWAWKRGDDAVARRAQPHPAPATNLTSPRSATSAARNFGPLLTRLERSAATRTGAAGQGSVSPVGLHPDPRFPHRLQNTTRNLEDLGRSDQAVLLRNALFDTASGVPLDVPAHLKSSADPGAYIVQARGALDDAFRRRLAQADAQIVSYIPNNAYLVRMDGANARQLRESGDAQAVLAYEPYFKLEQNLLALAVENASIPEGKELVLALFADAFEDTVKGLKQLGTEVLRQDRSPFGPLLYVKARSDSLVALAQLTGVQGIEEAHPRALMNDLSRVTLSVTPDTVVSNNYLGLTGSNIVVNVNDTGVDANHPDLIGRVLTAPPAADVDYAGHGTHVAGTIASSGLNSGTITNADGSLTNASFRGIAPASKIFPLRVFLLTGPELSDVFLQETAAATNTQVFRRTNAIVSNNSWGYVSDGSYNFATAGYDAAVRDALPAVTGAQPVLYVFAAGNNGYGEDNGRGGIPGTVSAPGTGKNVITVAASENFRGITNETWAPYTDSRDEIASFSSRGNVGAGIEGPNGRFKPDVTAPGTFIVSTRATGWLPWTGTDLDQLDDALGPLYRYESGTSMAAPAISGLLALMQEFFENVLMRDYSPALLKALLINGARSVGPLYDVSPFNYINFQGWGLANLTNSLPGALTNATTESKWPVRFMDESATNALATGDSRTWRFRLSEEAIQSPLRITLAWTDPAGNPAASIKLVNDLDLVLTNLDSGEVFFGNNIPQGTDFTVANPTNTYSGVTNTAPPAPPAYTDYVNNVENIFLREALGTNFTVTVNARRVNVNAIPANTNAVVQDFALVIASPVVSGTAPFATFTFEPLLASVFEVPIVTFTNGLPILNQHVGANLPLTNSMIGTREQWNFYRFDNSLPPSELSGLTNGSNVAFITFIPPNLSKPRAFDADIDLYVSKDSNLTNLAPATLAASFKSLNQGGTEIIVFTNASRSDVFYVAVKSEDQMGAEFGIVGLSTDLPFDDVDEFGNRTLYGMPPTVGIADGSAGLPSASYQFAIATGRTIIARTIVTNFITHESIGDLFGHLSHGNSFAVLNNHRVGDEEPLFEHNYIYDDSNSGEFRGARTSDGPGSLAVFTGQEALGLPFILAQSDNALNHTGRVQMLRIRLEPNAFDEDGLDDFVLPGQFKYYFVDVPTDASLLTVFLSNMSGDLNLYLRKEFLPTDTTYDKFALISPPAGSLAIGFGDVPPLSPGRWIVGVYNPGASTVSYHIAYKLERTLSTDFQQSFTSTGGPVTIPDDAITPPLGFTLSILNSRPVADLSVGLRIDHPRVADLSIRLVSPLGDKVLLVENRGGTTTNGFGAGTDTNIVYAGFTDTTNLSLGPIKFAIPPFGTNAVVFTNSVGDFEGLVATNYYVGQIVDGWQVVTNSFSPPTSTNVTVVTRGAQAHGGTNVLALQYARITRQLPTVAGRRYLFRFYYSGLTSQAVHSEVIVREPSGAQIARIDLRSTGTTWLTVPVAFTAAASGTLVEIKYLDNQPGMVLDDFQLIESGGTQYYTPEEPLKPLIGQSAVGDWQLEVLDSRAGPLPNTAALISWQLNFVFAPTNPPAITLTNGIAYSGTVTDDEIKYFIVDVPRSATLATNTLTPTSGGDLVLLYNDAGLPNGTQPGDVAIDFSGPGGPEILRLDTINPPLLRPGQRYYLGVRNFAATGTRDFTLLVEFDRIDNNRPTVTLLNSGLPRSATLAVTNVMDYYQFDVTTNANEVLFEVVPSGGNVSLFARQWTAGVVNPLPTTAVYDYRSVNPGTNAESILIDTNSFPVPLSPGTWYLGVLNVDTQPVPYTITATELNTSSSVFIPLTDSVALTFTNPIATQLFNVFQLNINTTNPAVRIELSGLSAAANLFVDLDRVPRPNSFAASMPGVPGQTAIMMLRTNRNFATLNGNLNFVVQGLGTNDLTFTLLVTQLTNADPIVADLLGDTNTAGRVVYSPFDPEIDYYRFTAATDVRSIDVTLTPIDGNVDLVVHYDLPLPTLAFYSDRSVNPGLTTETLTISRQSLPDPAAAGDWYLGVVNRQNRPVAYSILVHETPGDAILTLTNAVMTPGFALARATDAYRIPVSAAATRVSVQLNVFGATPIDSLALYLKKDLPVPSFATHDYLPFVHDQTQIFEITTNSVPVPLSPGDWYLAVENTTDALVSYDVTFTESTNDLGLATNVLSAITYRTATNTVIAWYSQNGRSYYVEGSTNSASGPWTPVSTTILATGGQSQRTLALDTPYQFFRVIEGTAPPIQVGIPRVLPDGSIQLSWNGYIGASYDLLTSADLLTWVTYTNLTLSAESGSVIIPPAIQANGYYLLRFLP